MKTKEEIFETNWEKYNKMLRGHELLLSVADQSMIHKSMQIYSDQETQSLREQLKEKEEALTAEIGAVEHMKELCDEYEKELQSQSTLIESLAGALKNILPLAEDGLKACIKSGSSHQEFIYEDKEDLKSASEALLQYDNFKKKENENSTI